VQLSVRASEAAAAVYAWDEALSHLRAALKLLERAGGPLPERARLAERAARLVYQASVDLEEGIGTSRRPWPATWPSATSWGRPGSTPSSACT
jgi:hypothetical protein